MKIEGSLLQRWSYETNSDTSRPLKIKLDQKGLAT